MATTDPLSNQTSALTPSKAGWAKDNPFGEAYKPDDPRSVAARQALAEQAKASNENEGDTVLGGIGGVIGGVIGAYFGGPMGAVAGFKAGQGVGKGVSELSTGRDDKGLQDVLGISAFGDIVGKDKKKNPDGTETTDGTDVGDTAGSDLGAETAVV